MIAVRMKVKERKLSLECWQIHKYVTILPYLPQAKIVAIELGIALQNHCHLGIRREKDF